MSFPGFLTPPDSDDIKAPKVSTGTMDLEELNARAHPEFKTVVEADDIIKLRNTSPVEDWNKKKRKRQDLDWSHRRANIPTNGYGLTKEEMKAYRESSDKFKNILAAHAASGVIPYVVDLKISVADHTRLLNARDSIREKLPIGDSLLTSLEFLDRWSRLQPRVFSKTEQNTPIDKWIENIKEQHFALRESTQWGPLWKLYEQLVVDETNFSEPQHASFESLDFDSD